MSVSVLNTDSGISGKTLDLLESDQTISGLKTFSRSPNAPFAVQSGSASVTNLDADKLDGLDSTYFTNASNLASGTVPTARLGSGAASSSTYLRGDQTWATVNAKPFMAFTAQANQPPASSYATPDTRNSHPVLVFVDASTTGAVFGSVLPASYGSGGLTVDIYWASATVTTGNVRWQASFESDAAGGQDIDSDGFATAQAATGTCAAGGSGILTKTSIAFTDGAQIDSLAAGDAFRVKIERVGGDAADTMADSAHLLRVVVRET